MFNIGFGELAIICIVLIIAVGPERLPSMMKTVGKTMRTLRQASRDLREQTGIDELLREDFSYVPPPRKPAPPPDPHAFARDASPVATEPIMDPTRSPMAPLPVTPTAEPPALGPAAAEAAAAAAGPSLPSDGPLTTGVPVEPAASLEEEAGLVQPAPVEYANIGATLPSDAPLSAPEPKPVHDADSPKSRES
jgi:Tat protein translocase TatB subunit